KWTLAHALNSLGEVTCAQGDYGRAATLCEESLVLCRELGNKEGVAWSLRNLGHVARYQGNHGQAVALFAEGLAVFWEQGNKLGIAACLAGLAGVVGVVGDRERAARLFGAVEALLNAIGATLAPTDQANYECNVGIVRAGLSEDAFAAAWAEGWAM